MAAQALIAGHELHSVAIFGAGLSGRAVTRLCSTLGMNYQVYDEAGMGDHRQFFRADVERYDGFIFSPGFASSHPWRVLAEKSNRPCLSELGFAMSFWRGKILGVTGTNGKTTVTNLLKCALEASGEKAVAAGNLDQPLSEYYLEYGKDSCFWAVCEISSFQAELPLGMQMDALIWTNFSEDHLDRYSGMQEYFEAKANLLHCLKPDSPVILGESVKAWNSSLSSLDTFSSRVEKLQLPAESPFASEPQVGNLRLVARLWAQLGLPIKGLEMAASNFQMAPHRLAKVAEWDDVCFWNDSKATNFSAALAALGTFGKPIFWIAGGQSKGGDLIAFAESAARCCEAIYLYGEVAEEMASAFRNSSPPVKVHQCLEEAVVNAYVDALKVSSAIVLLSPGFASFGDFESYADRGENFISTVLSLKNQSSTS